MTKAEDVAKAIIDAMQVADVKVTRIEDHSRHRDDRLIWHIWLDGDCKPMTEAPTTIVLGTHPRVPPESLATIVAVRKAKGML